MKFFKWVLVTLSVLVTLLFFIAIPSPIAETQVFCAYGRLFVEFNEGGRRWGTIMLDFQGHPIPCREEGELKIETTI